jgi:hypothetical protein
MNVFTSWIETVEKRIETASQLITTVLEDDEMTLGLAYVTPRIVAMGFPPCSTLPDNSKKVDPRVASYLRKRHGNDKYMVWNLSEVSYDGLSAVEFRFPGHPSAPLGALFELCTSLDSWLQADEANIAIVHCLTGKGRTLTVLACYLAWSGYRNFTPQQALSFVCEKKGMKLLEATIPSQRRYVEYFSRALDGVRPRAEPIVLRKARAFGVPKGSLLQAYVDGGLAFTGKGLEEDANGVVTFANINATLDGDVLMRIRFEDPKTKVRTSIFRVAIHSGYTPSGTFRLERGDLDGGTPDAWMEIEFDPAERGTATSNMKITKGVATSENAFWEMISKRRIDIRTKALENGTAAFAIATPQKLESNGQSSNGKGSSATQVLVIDEEDSTMQDDLEKELGQLLEATTSKKAQTPTASSAPTPLPDNADANLDELEQYLQKLGS